MTFPHVLSEVLVVTLTQLARVLRAAAAECDRIAAEQERAPVAQPAQGDWLPLRDAGVSIRTLRAAIAAGELPAVKVGREYQLRRADLDAWRSAHRVAPRDRKTTQPKPQTAAQRALARAQARGDLRVVGAR